ncbi:S-layer homology domain-containing protein [Candidatus Peribacteria bacterium]|nr:S-layer homology domain-containing protein [Candidatus Peribacteria bacterium]
MRHVLVLLAAAVLSIFTPLGGVSAAGTPASDYVLSTSIMFAPVDGSFNEAGLINRLEFTLATINHLYAAEDFDGCYKNISATKTGDFQRLFTDVESSEWYAKELCVGMHSGLIQGHADGSFRPFATISVAEASKILSKAYGLTQGSMAGKAWYKMAMKSLQIRGALADTASPATSLTRGNMAEMFYALRNTPVLSMVPVTPTEGEPIVPTIDAEPVTASLSQKCITSIGGGSPGAALIVLGQTARPNFVERRSRRILEAEVEQSYMTGVQPFSRKTNEKAVISRCGPVFARSPGIVLLLRGIQAKPLSLQKIPNRILKQQAEMRDHVGGIQIDPNTAL